MEYLNRFENYFLTTAATARFVLGRQPSVAPDEADSFHAYIEEKDYAKAIASCAKETIHIHVSENDRGIPGTGQVHWDSFWSGLKASGFDGYLTIEAFGRVSSRARRATRVCSAICSRIRLVFAATASPSRNAAPPSLMFSGAGDAPFWSPYWRAAHALRKFCD